MDTSTVPSREQLLHALYEAAELEHNLMCTYLYAAFSLRTGEDEGLRAPRPRRSRAGARRSCESRSRRWAISTAVWNITSALGGSPRFGRGNFPLDPGALPAGVVVKLAPFNDAVLQHFIYLERPDGSDEPDGEGFAARVRSSAAAAREARLTPMAIDYDTVGTFYATLGERLAQFVAHHGEAAAFCGDPALQLSPTEIDLVGAKPVICSKTALAAFDAIVEQGEGAPTTSLGSHFQQFLAIREEMRALERANPALQAGVSGGDESGAAPADAAAGRVWIENEDAAVTVDLANTGYMLMLRLIAYSYAVPRPSPEKALAIDLALGADARRHAPRRARGAAARGAVESGLQCRHVVHALRDAAPLPPGAERAAFFIERLRELATAAACAANPDARMSSAARVLADLAQRGERGFTALAEPSIVVPVGTARAGTNGGRASDTPAAASTPASATPAAGGASAASPTPPPPRVVDGVDDIEGAKLTLLYEGKQVHPRSRFCVTGAPKVFLANVEGPWINPDAMDVELLAEIAHVVPVRRDPLSAQGRQARRDRAAGESDRDPRSAGRTPCAPTFASMAGPRGFARRCAAAARRRTSRSATARTTRSISPRPASRRPASRHAGRARRPARDRSAARRAAAGPRQPRDHERHGPRGRARDERAAVPLRRKQHQAVLRRLTCQSRLPLDLARRPVPLSPKKRCG